jgi:hypothetical protein
LDFGLLKFCHEEFLAIPTIAAMKPNGINHRLHIPQLKKRRVARSRFVDPS